jgi:hypothetical protein
MAITVITSQRKRRKFLTYDLEWIPGTLEVRLVGVFDGYEYRHYYSVEEFIIEEVIPANATKWFYAHAGGLADVQFVLEALLKFEGFQIKAAFSGSSAIIVNVRKNKQAWRFVDSFWLLRDSLANIAKSLGMKKGGDVPGFENFTEAQKKDFFTNIPILELRDYNEQDCRILWTAIQNFEDRIWEWQGQLKMTQASTALELFRRRFLLRDIDTFESLNEVAKDSYFASRVEVLNHECFDANYYDINSSFPYAMMSPCPGNYLGASRRLPDDGLYVADVEFEIGETYFPPAPTRVGGRVFFPMGRWRSWLSNVDIELLQEEGHRLIKCYEAHRFAPFTDLAEYVSTIYEKRKNSNDPFEKQVLKILMNSLYGKFGESSEKTAMHFHPSEKQLDAWELGETEVHNLFPGCWLEYKKEKVEHAHVAISAHITALARRKIFEYMSNCSTLHYCDTDGFSTNDELGVTGNELGQLKFEKRIGHGNFVAPKVYRLDDKVKAKGFSLSRDKDKAIQQFEALKAGENIVITRMTRLRELYRNQETKPKEALIKKGLTSIVTGKSVGKRHSYPDGNTRPWHIKELHEMLLPMRGDAKVE